MAYRGEFERVAEVQKKYTQELMNKPHVIGVAIGPAKVAGSEVDELALVVMVNQKVPTNQLDLDDIIPSRLDGVRVDVQETGAFSAF